MQRLTTYAERREFGDAPLTTAKEILAAFFGTSVNDIETADELSDMRKATDLRLKDGTTIAVRVRDDAYREQFGDEITVRDYIGRDGRSEWQKFNGGCVAYAFYAFRDDAGRLTAWKVVDVRELTEALFWNPILEGRALRRHEPPGREPFYSVRLTELTDAERAQVVVASGGDE